jgi:hypothetical protein
VSRRQQEVRAALVHHCHLDVDGGIEPELDVLSFALDSFINYLVNDTSRYHEFATFINERPNFYNRFNIKPMDIYDLSMLSISKFGARVAKEYVLGQLYSMESYLHMPPAMKEE